MDNPIRCSALRAVCVGGLAAAISTEGQESHGDALRREFRGYSAEGDLDEALRNALASAYREFRSSGAGVAWTLMRVAGSREETGELSVTIEAHPGSDLR